MQAGPQPTAFAVLEPWVFHPSWVWGSEGSGWAQGTWEVKSLVRGVGEVQGHGVDVGECGVGVSGRSAGGLRGPLLGGTGDGSGPVGWYVPWVPTQLAQALPASVMGAGFRARQTQLRSFRISGSSSERRPLRCTRAACPVKPPRPIRGCAHQSTWPFLGAVALGTRSCLVF